MSTNDAPPSAPDTSKFRISFDKGGRSLPIAIYMIAILWFVAQTGYLALHIDFGIAPDEVHHLHVSRAYHESPTPWIVDTPETYYLGTVGTANVPFLHHLVAGKLLALNLFGIDDRFFLRFVSIFFAVLFLITVIELLRELKASLPVQVATLGLLVNVPMFVMVASAASYDNLTNLLALRFQLALLRFLRRRSVDDLLYAIVFLGAGSLGKVTILPLYVVAGVVLLLSIKPVARSLCTFAHGFTWERGVLTALTIAVIAGNATLYGTNLSRYGALLPSSDVVLGHEITQRHYQESKVLQSLLKTRDERPLMPMNEFVEKFSIRVRDTIFGIMGHKEYLQPRRVMRRIMKVRWVLLAGLGFALFAFIRYRRRALPDTWPLYLVLFGTALYYYVFLIFYNHETYATYRVFGTSLQGRYLFPVLGDLVIMLATIALAKVPRVLAWPAALYGCYFFTSYGWLYILKRLPPEWFVAG